MATYTVILDGPFEGRAMRNPHGFHSVGENAVPKKTGIIFAQTKLDGKSYPVTSNTTDIHN